MLVLMSTAWAAGWTQPVGGWYGKLGARGVYGRHGFDVDGSVVEDVGAYADTALQVYGELGVADGWTVVLSSAPLGYASFEGASTLYVGPTRTGVRRALTRGTVATAVEARLGFTPAIGAVDLDPGDGVYQPTYGSYGGDLELQAGWGWGKGWLSGAAGYRYEAQLSDVVIGMVQVGRQWERFVLDVHVPVHLPLSPASVPNWTGAGDSTYVGLGLGLSWSLGPVAVGTGLDTGPVARSNAAAPSLPLFVSKSGSDR